MKKPSVKARSVEDVPFISPTMEVLHKDFPGWMKDKEKLYTLGFNLATLRDEYGFDVYGFNEDGIDRLGCSAKDYERPDIGRETFMLASYKCQGNHKPHYSERILKKPLSVSLPKMLEIRKAFDNICEEQSGVRPIWFNRSGGGLSCQPRASSWFGNDEYTIRYQWVFENREYEFLVRSGKDTSTVSTSGAIDRPLNLTVRIKSPFTSGGTAVFELRCDDVAGVQNALTKLASDFLKPARDYRFALVVSVHGPKLVACLESEIGSVNADVLDAVVVGTSPLDALERYAKESKTNFIRMAAVNGLKSLSEVPELQKRVEVAMGGS